MRGRGQASVIGGLFAIVVMLLLFMTAIYVEGRYLELMRESFSRLHRRLNSPESLELEVNCSRVLRPAASSVVTITVKAGDLVSGDASSLDAEGDDDYLVIASTLGREEVIRNGEFDEGFKYWMALATQGEWSVVSIDGDNVAEHYVAQARPSAMASLGQNFTVSEEFEEATLEFDYYMQTPEGQYVIEVRINDVQVFYNMSNASVDWTHVGPIDVTEQVRVGRNALYIKVSYLTPRKSYTFRIDSVSLKVTPRAPPTYPPPEVDVRFNVSVPSGAVNGTFTLTVACSEPADVYLYALDCSEGVWRLLSGAYAEDEGWFHFNVTVGEEFLSGGAELRLYAVGRGVSNFTLLVDYLGIAVEVFTPDSAHLVVKNVGSTSAYVISAWLINETGHYRVSVESYVDPGEELRVQLANSTLRLSWGSRYLVRVWTPVRSHEVAFTTPG